MLNGEFNFSKPYMSIILTAYNRKEFLKEALESIFDQKIDKTQFEIIVIKNFHDEVIDKLIQFNNVQMIIMEGTVGSYLLAGLEASKGEILCFLDDDDKFLPNKLDSVVQIFRKNEDVIYYHNTVFYMDKYGHLINSTGRRQFLNPFIVNGNLLTKEDLIYILKYSGDFNISSISIKKSVLLRFKDILPKITAHTDSFLFFCASSLNGHMYFDKEPLTYYRIHDSTSGIPQETQTYQSWARVNYRDSINTYDLISSNIELKTGKERIYCRLASSKLRYYFVTPDYQIEKESINKYIKCALASGVSYAIYSALLIIWYILIKLFPKAGRIFYLAIRFP